MCAPMLASACLLACQRNTTPRQAHAAEQAPMVTAASWATAAVGLSWAYGGRENPATVSQPMPAIGTDATSPAANDIRPDTRAQAISTPGAVMWPFSPAATVPIARNAA